MTVGYLTNINYSAIEKYVEVFSGHTKPIELEIKKKSK
jgi:hypothetical protein